MTNNNEDKIVLANFLDKARLCRGKNVATCTKFLTPAQQVLVCDLARSDKITNFGLYGVSDDAERKIAVFYPDYTDFDSCKQDFIALIRCKKSNQDTLGHRDYLGSILGLGLKRDVVGDIFIHETGADVAVLQDISGFLLTNYSKAGRKNLELSVIGHDQLIAGDDNGEACRDTLSSLRLDCVVASFWNLSRSQSEEQIVAGRVLLNGMECKKTDRPVKPGDKVNLRGKGKCVFHETLGQSKKGKTIVSFTRYR